MSKTKDIPPEKKELVSKKTGLDSSATMFKGKAAPKERHYRFSADKLKEIKLNFISGPEKLIRKLTQLTKKIPQDELKALYEAEDYKYGAGCTLYEDIRDGVSTKPLFEREPICVYKNVHIKIKESTKDPVLKSTQSAEAEKETAEEISFDNWEAGEETDFWAKMEFEVDGFATEYSPHFKNKYFPDIYLITDNLFVMDGPYSREDLVSFFEQCLFKPEIRDGIHKVMIFSRIKSEKNLKDSIQDYVTANGLTWLSDHYQGILEPNIYLVLLPPPIQPKQQSAFQRDFIINYRGDPRSSKEQKIAGLKIDPSKIDVEKPINDQVLPEILDKIFLDLGALGNAEYLYRITPLSEKVMSEQTVQVNTFSIRSAPKESIYKTTSEELETVLFYPEKIKEENYLEYPDVLLDFYEASLKENVLIQGPHPEYLLLLFQFLKNYDEIFNATHLDKAKAKIEEIVNTLQKNLPLIQNEKVIWQAITDAEKLHDYQLTTRAAPATVPAPSL